MFCTCILWLASLCDSEPLEDDLISWNRLKREAGYFTTSRRWRGGIWKFARSSNAVTLDCIETPDGRCALWKTNPFPTNNATEFCLCNDRKKPFCKAWSCSETTPDPFCNCETTSSDAICEHWHCLDFRTQVFSKHFFSCLETSMFGTFCKRWTLKSETEYDIHSSACQCDVEEGTICVSWSCEKREIVRCEAHRGGWCRMEFAFGIGGTAGIVLTCLVHFFTFHSSKGSKSFLKFFLRYVFFVWPWVVGVLLWGGTRGCIYVLPLWGIVLILLEGKRMSKCRSSENNDQELSFPKTTKRKMYDLRSSIGKQESSIGTKIAVIEEEFPSHMSKTSDSIRSSTGQIYCHSFDDSQA